MYVVYSCEHRFLWRRIDPLGSGITGDCEMLGAGSGKQTLVLCKSGKWSCCQARHISSWHKEFQCMTFFITGRAGVSLVYWKKLTMKKQKEAGTSLSQTKYLSCPSQVTQQHKWAQSLLEGFENIPANAVTTGLIVPSIPYSVFGLLNLR